MQGAAVCLTRNNWLSCILTFEPLLFPPVQRLQHEVEQPAEEPRPGGPPSSAPPSAGEAMLTKQAAAGAGAAAAGAAAGEGPSTSAAAAQQAQQAAQKVVPYARRLLLKSLLRAIAIASYGVGNQQQLQRANEADAATLHSCLKVRPAARVGPL